MKRKQTQEDIAAEFEAMGSITDARLRGLRNLAIQLLRDRHANGEPVPARRPALRRAIRPDLRRAIKALRQSRDALLAGDVERHELYRDRARMFWFMTLLRLRNPYSNRAGKQAMERPRHGLLGAAATADSAMQRNAKLDSLIAGCLARGEPIRDRVKVWANEWGVSRQTVYNRIRRAKSRMSK